MESFDDAERRLARKLGDEIRRRREHKDLTRGALARKAGHYSRSTIATVETGWGRCSLKLIQRCDDTLEAGGAVVGIYLELREAQGGGPVRITPSSSKREAGIRRKLHPRTVSGG